MKQPSFSSKWSPLKYGILVLIFGYLSIRARELTVMLIYKSYWATWVDLHWVFWLMSGLTVIFSIPLIVMTFRMLRERHLLAKPIEAVYGEEFQRKFAVIRSWLKLRMQSLGGELSLVGVAILLIVGFISKTSFVHETQLNNYLNEWILATLGGSSDGRPGTVLELALTQESSDGNQYLKNCLKIVRDLESVGVKAVLIDLRRLSFSTKSVDERLLDELSKSKIVVFGAPDGGILRKSQILHGIHTLRPYEVPSNFPDRQMLMHSSALLCRIKPAGDNVLSAISSLDVTLELLRKFKNYPADLRPHRDGSTLVFGDYTIPTTEEGWMYSRDRWTELALWARILAGQGFESDSLVYTSLMYVGAKGGTNLEFCRDRFEGKIFLISWGEGLGFEAFLYNRAYASALESIIQKNVIRKSELSPLWLTIACIAFSAFLAYRWPPLDSILSIFLFGVMLALADSLLYDRMDILIEVIYPLLSVLLAMFIFPTIAFVHRLRLSD
jgi:hypothetical protein